MKLTIRTNPVIVIEIEQDKAPPFPATGAILAPKPLTPIVPDVKPEPEEKIERTGKGVRHCKKCGEAGHRSEFCPQNGAGTMKEKILNLKDEGLTEDEVADRLGISIHAVNKYWDD